jgi:hypothetical protein
VASDERKIVTDMAAFEATFSEEDREPVHWFHAQLALSQGRHAVPQPGDAWCGYALGPKGGGSTVPGDPVCGACLRLRALNGVRS